MWGEVDGHVVMSIEVRYGGLFLRFRGVWKGDSGVFLGEMALL